MVGDDPPQHARLKVDMYESCMHPSCIKSSWFHNRVYYTSNHILGPTRLGTIQKNSSLFLEAFNTTCFKYQYLVKLINCVEILHVPCTIIRKSKISWSIETWSLHRPGRQWLYLSQTINSLQCLSFTNTWKTISPEINLLFTYIWRGRHDCDLCFQYSMVTDSTGWNECDVNCAAVTTGPQQINI